MRMINSQNQDLVEALIRKYGHSPWHNYYHYENCEGKGERNFVFEFDGSGAILARRKKRIWHIFSEVLAEPRLKLAIFEEFLKFCFSDPDVEKVSMEFEEDFRNDVLSLLRSSPWRSCRVKYELTCSVFDLLQWDEQLQGKRWKKLRQQIHQFYKTHRVEILDSAQLSSAELKQIVQDWRQKRKQNDRAYYHPYLKAIENCFAGTRLRRTFVIDGIPSTITAGWDIPNQEGHYYSAIGIHNYRFDHLGIVSYIDDLSFLKSQGVRFANFGGGWGGLLNFKMKFRPNSFYVTHAFSIKRVNDASNQKE
jgi:hypothetical protein